MTNKKRVTDELEAILREDFKPVMEKIKEIESFTERNLIDLDPENIDEMEIDVLEEAARELMDQYKNFLDEILTIAGSIKYPNNRGTKYIEKLEKFPDKIDQLTWNIVELKGTLKNPNLHSEKLGPIAIDLIKNINNQIREIRRFLSEEIYSIVDGVFQELKKLETYYE